MEIAISEIPELRQAAIVDGGAVIAKSLEDVQDVVTYLRDMDKKLNDLESSD
jgi:hypothetical protein